MHFKIRFRNSVKGNISILQIIFLQIKQRTKKHGEQGYKWTDENTKVND